MFGPRSMWSECTVRISFATETGHFIVEPPCENWGGPRSQWLKPSRWGEDTVAGRGFGLKPIRDRILVTFIDIHSVACHYFWWWLAFAKTDLIDVCSGLVFNRSVRAMYPWPNIYSWCMLPSETLVSTSCPAQSSLPFLLDTSDFILCKCWMLKVALERLLLSGTCWRSPCCPKAHRCPNQACNCSSYLQPPWAQPKLSRKSSFHFMAGSTYFCTVVRCRKIF